MTVASSIPGRWRRSWRTTSYSKDSSVLAWRRINDGAGDSQSVQRARSRGDSEFRRMGAIRGAANYRCGRAAGDGAIDVAHSYRCRSGNGGDAVPDGGRVDADLRPDGCAEFRPWRL